MPKRQLGTRFIIKHDYSHLETVQFDTINSAILRKIKFCTLYPDVYNIDKQNDGAAFHNFLMLI
jgi:hypothetical protein